jgi:dTMP kinase
MYGPGVALGRLITIEGLDGAGKTTLASSLGAELARRGIDVRVLREPGGVELSERIRALVKDPVAHVVPRTEALLYAAARAQLCEELLVPLLAEGVSVLLDRFVDSSLAYQGEGRALGIAAVREVNRFATGDIVPDRTLLLRVDPAAGRARQQERPELPDRLESVDDGFFLAVARGYEELAAQEPERVRVIDADQPPDLVLADALEAIADLIGPGAGGD